MKMENKILNSKTKRFVLKTGKIGKELLKNLDKMNINSNESKTTHCLQKSKISNSKKNIRLNDDILYYITNHIEFNLIVISNIIKVSKLYKNFYLKYKKELSIYNTFINNIKNNNYITIIMDDIIVINNLYFKKHKFIKNLLLEDKCKLTFKCENSNNYTIILYDIYELILLALEMRYENILKKIETINDYYRKQKIPKEVILDYVSYILEIARILSYYNIKTQFLIYNIYNTIKLTKICLFSLLNTIIQENDYSKNLNTVLKVKQNELKTYLIQENHLFPQNFCNELIKNI